MSSVPDFGAPTERRLPFRSASVLMPDSLRGDHLDVVGIDGGDAAQLVELALEAGLLVAGPAQREAVAEGEADLALALLQQGEVFHRSLGGLDRRAGALHLVGEDLGERDAERVIDAGGAAGQDVDEVLGLGRHARTRKRKGGRGADDAAHDVSIHGVLPDLWRGFR